MTYLKTNRLLLRPIALEDADFMLKLINCPGFLRFIGDRNIRTLEQSEAYIENLIKNPDITYWVIQNKISNVSYGVVTWVKRDYLPSPDLGYAILPEFEGNGFALEASSTWLTHHKQNHKRVLAICQADNVASIHLLLKLGFILEEKFEKEGIPMQQYTHD